MKLLLLLVLITVFPKRNDAPRAFHVIIVSDNVVRRVKSGEQPVKQMDKLMANESVTVPAAGYCVLFDNRGNVFELAGGTKVALDTLKGRARHASVFYIDPAKLSSHVGFTPVIMDGNDCNVRVVFPTPFGGFMEFNRDDVIPIVGSTHEPELKLEVKDQFEEHVADVDLPASGRIDLLVYADKLNPKDQYIIKAKFNCVDAPFVGFTITEKKVRFHDLNLTDAAPALLQKALFFEYKNSEDKANELYKLAIAKASPDQAAAYQNFFDLFKERNKR